MSAVGRKMSLVSTRPQDADKFAAYKAQKAAQKDAERAKLAAEFPHLFGNDKMKATKEKYTIVKPTPSKRKASNPTTECADENVANIPSDGYSVPPNSAKKLRVVKPNSSLSTKPPVSKGVSAGKKNVGFGSTIPKEEPTAQPTRKPSFTLPSFSFTSSSKVAEAKIKQIPAEVEVEMESFKTSVPATRMAAERPAAPVTVPPCLSDEDIQDLMETEVEVHELAVEDPSCSTFEPIAEPAEPVEEQVQDVLDYLLENDEVDKQLHERLSRNSHSITATSIRRLSTVRQSLLPMVVSASAVESVEVITQEGCVQDEQVLDAVRAIVNTMKESASFDTWVVGDQGEKVVEEEAVSVAAAIAATVEEAELARAEADSDETQQPPVSPTHNATVAPETEIPITPSATKIVSWSVTEDSAEANAKAAGITPNKLVKTPTKVRTHPRAMFLDEAMRKGLLAAEVFKYESMGNHIKYFLNMKVISESDAGACSMKMLLLKRYSEFKNLRSDLLSVLADEKKDLIGELPARDTACVTGPSAEQETALQQRLEGLHEWLQGVLAHQSTTPKEFRDRIYAFVSN